MLNLLPAAQNSTGVIRTFCFLIELHFHQILISLCDTNRLNVSQLTSKTHNKQDFQVKTDSRRVLYHEYMILSFSVCACCTVYCYCMMTKTLAFHQWTCQSTLTSQWHNAKYAEPGKDGNFELNSSSIK